MRRMMPLIVLIVIFLGGCATTTPVSTTGQLKQAGLLSKQLAVTAYQAIYAAYKQGAVNDVQMRQADKAYNHWRTIQAEYVAAASSGQRPSVAVHVQEALSDLLFLAAEFGVL